MKLVRVGMNMEEATIAAWHKNVGDRVTPGEPLYSIETDKVTQDVEANANGKLVEILVPAGSDAKVGQGVCVVDLEL